MDDVCNSVAALSVDYFLGQKSPIEQMRKHDQGRNRMHRGVVVSIKDQC